ncbi:hypothetical protein LEP1GSC068_0361 [Leptospira sp. Fiocruz LV3954]|nr:hypothetical protein LEP1GSC068_0361 [Leptospira sp. Fiocruz LV3954]EMI64056.1 hypothetical protein LEP1GSC076_2468 [Leptospira sp. Fiocruz LV4135]EMO13639.1 hypothetical protein LEP1GSC165_1635 [Leptospira santarosai str. CBC523]
MIYLCIKGAHRENNIMNLETILALCMGMFCLLYLAYTIFKPEEF